MAGKRQMTTEEFKEKIRAKWGNKYTIISSYEGSHDLIHILFNKCKHDVWVTATRVMSGTGCRICANNTKHDTKWYEDQVEKLTHGEYIVVGKYSNNHTPVDMYHVVCHKKISPTPKDFIYKGVRCERCAGNHVYTYEEILEELNERGFTALFAKCDYTTTNGTYRIMHNKCKYYRDVNLESVLRNPNMCPMCSGKLPVDFEEFKRRVHSVFGDRYTYISGFVDTQKKVKMYCNKCKHPFRTHPYNLFNGHGCYSCSSSTGEKLVRTCCDELNITYVSQKTFKDCRDRYVLPFDFYLPDYNLCIEYDGKQHYEPRKHFGGVEGFERRKYHDQLKNDYCKQHHINLLRIPYKYRTYKQIKGKILEYLSTIA